MTSNEAVTLIEAATDPRALFGADPRREYRRLARLTHPDVPAIRPTTTCSTGRPRRSNGCAPAATAASCRTCRN